VMDDCLDMSALDVARLLLVTFNCAKSRHTNSTGDNEITTATRQHRARAGWGVGREEWGEMAPGMRVQRLVERGMQRREILIQPRGQNGTIFGRAA
jgi:hypothetical protein